MTAADLTPDHELILRAMRDRELETETELRFRDRTGAPLEVIGARASKLAGGRVGIDRTRRTLLALCRRWSHAEGLPPGMTKPKQEPLVYRRRSWASGLRYYLTERGRAKADELRAALELREDRGRVERQPEATAAAPTVNPD